MNYIFFDKFTRSKLLPFTYTRAIADIRIGILTLREKWEKHLNCSIPTVTTSYPIGQGILDERQDILMLNATILPYNNLIAEIKNLKPGQWLCKGESRIALRTHSFPGSDSDFDSYEKLQFDGELLEIKNIWDIFTLNDEALKLDFKLITNERVSQPLSDTNRVLAPENIFLEEGAVVEFTTLNASKGPIYIGSNAEVMEGSMIRGSFSLGDHGLLKMGTRIYGATSFGPYCKVGGEVNNSVIFGYSNKGHDGFLGNSVIGEWCNLGAATNNSNLKNNYSEVKVWDYKTSRSIKSGLQFCGFFMGDHSKCGINTMFNTGTVIGVGCNIFGGGLIKEFVPSFSWGGASGFVDYNIDKACEAALTAMQRRGFHFGEKEKQLFKHLFEITAKYRDYREEKVF